MLQSVRRARSGATTGNACRRTSFATPWSLAGMEATSRGARAGGKEGKEGEEGTRWRRLDAHLDATTADVVPTRSPAAAATVAATVPTRGVVPFAVSMQDDIYIIYFFFFCFYPFFSVQSHPSLRCYRMLAFPLNLIEAETISGFDDTGDTLTKEDIYICIYDGIAIGNKGIERKREGEKKEKGKSGNIDRNFLHIDRILESRRSSVPFRCPCPSFRRAQANAEVRFGHVSIRNWRRMRASARNVATRRWDGYASIVCLASSPAFRITAANNDEIIAIFFFRSPFRSSIRPHR